MIPTWNEEQLMLRSSIIDFAKNELNDGLIERDRDGVFSRENWVKCANLGLHGLCVPQEYGGSGQDSVTAMLAMESLGYACKDNGLIFAINAQMWSVQTPILRYGSEEQKSNYLPRLVNGEMVAAHGMTEPESGSDSFDLSTSAEKRENSYVLNGTKVFSTNAPVADLFLVFATTNKARGFMGLTVFLVEKGTPGLSVSCGTEKMGLRTAPFGEVVLQDCEVNADQRLGREGNGAMIFRHSMEWERSCIMAAAVGSMERQVEACTEYAKSRSQFGQNIGKFQSVSNKIVDMKLRLETSRLLLYQTAHMREQGQDISQHSAMTKLHISESFVQSSLDAIQIHGGYGYTTELEIERDLRDSIAGRIYSGTSEIQRELIARSMGL